MHFGYLWALLASICAVGLETFVKKTTGSWFGLLPYTIIPILLLNFSLFKLLRASDSILTAFVLFAVANIVIRITSAIFVLHETVKVGTWTALVLLVLAQVAKWSL